VTVSDGQCVACREDAALPNHNLCVYCAGEHTYHRRVLGELYREQAAAEERLAELEGPDRAAVLDEINRRADDIRRALRALEVYTRENSMTQITEAKP
jgi:hypothetical protein